MDFFFSVYMYKLKLYGALCLSTGFACLKGLGKKIYALGVLLILVITPPLFNFFYHFAAKKCFFFGLSIGQSRAVLSCLDMLCLKKHLFSFAKRIGFKLLKRARVMLYSLRFMYKCLYKNISQQHNNFSYFKKVCKKTVKKSVCIYRLPVR